MIKGKDKWVIGELNFKVAVMLDLIEFAGKKIYIGKATFKHIRDNHYLEYVNYINLIGDIIKEPAFIANHPKNNSIEYIKVINGEKYILVAVRPTSRGVLFIRTMFEMSDIKIQTYIKNNFLIKY